VALRHTPITAHGAEMGHRLVEAADHCIRRYVVGPADTGQAARSTSQWIAAPAPSEFDDLLLSATAVASASPAEDPAQSTAVASSSPTEDPAQSTAVASSSPTEDPAQSTAAHAVESFNPMATSPNRAPDDRWRPRSAPLAWPAPVVDNPRRAHHGQSRTGTGPQLRHASGGPGSAPWQGTVLRARCPTT